MSVNPDKGSVAKKTAYIFLILIITFLVYKPTERAGFTNWDDDKYITRNKDITSFEKYKTSLLTEVYAGNYHPLTMLSFTFDYAVGKSNPKVYHRTNVLIHLVNSVLVFFLILSLIGNAETALICGILFGVHPLQTESVAWISERKNVLYTLFFLSSLIVYIQYIQKNRSLFYFLALFLFILSLFSKGMAVTLSLVLIAIDLLFKRKITDKKVILEKIPFLSLSLLFGLIAIEAQPMGAEIDPTRMAPLHNPFYEKLLYAVYNIGAYILHIIFPFEQAAFYPYPQKTEGILPLQYYLLPVIILTLLAVFIFWSMKKKIYKWKYLLFGLIFFFINIALVLQLFPVGDAIRADRYVYIPSIGIFLSIGILYQYINEYKRSLAVFFILILSGYALWLSNLAYNRCKIWKSSIILWTDQIKKYPEQGMAYNNRGIARHEQNDLEGALEDYKKCIELDQRFYKAYNNKGILETSNRNYPAAIADFSKSIELEPDYADAYLNRARARYSSRDYIGSIDDCARYLKHDSLNYHVFLISGMSRIHTQKYQEAVHDFTKASLLAPDNPEIYSNRGVARSILGDFTHANADFSKAIELAPAFNAAYFNRAKVRFSLNMNKEACLDLQKAYEYGHPQAEQELAEYCK